MVVVSLALLVALLGAWESYVRAGDTANAPHDVRRDWLRRVRDMERAESPRIVVLGSSRAQFAVNPSAVTKETRGTPCFNLGMPLGNALSMLESIEGDLHAGDVVVLEVFPATFFAGSVDPAQRAVQERLAGARIPRLLEDNASEAAGRSLALFRADYGPLEVTHSTLRRLMGRPMENLQGDDWLELKFHGDGWIESVVLKGSRQEWEDRVDQWQSPEDILSQRPQTVPVGVTVQRCISICSRLEARGVHARFMRMPCSGRFARVEEAKYPRSAFWDVLSAALPGRCLHFADDAQFRDFWTPDGSHLEANGALVFSRRLGRWIKDRVAKPLVPLGS